MEEMKGLNDQLVGVNAYRNEVIAPGDKASRLAKDICFGSHKNCLALTVVPHQPGNFRGPVGWVWKKHILNGLLNHELDCEGNIASWEMLEEKENDGAGGKLQFHALLGDAETFYFAGREILAMTADDFARSGRFHAIFANDINTKAITEENFALYDAMMRGYGDALREIGGVNITGEVAIMKNSVTAFCDDGSKEMLIVNWGASCIGLAHRDKLIDGSKIRPGMPIVGFWEPGYRCNGGTLLTNIVQRHFVECHNRGMSDFVRKCAKPSIIYAPFLTRMNGWLCDGSVADAPIVKMAGIAHITGGGVWEKFGDILPEGVGAVLSDMPTPANILLEAKRISSQYDDLRLTDWQAYSTFHGGCGMLVVCETETDADRLIYEANISHYKADRVGVTTKSFVGEIMINSKFTSQKKMLSSECPE